MKEIIYCIFLFPALALSQPSLSVKAKFVARDSGALELEFSVLITNLGAVPVIITESIATDCKSTTFGYDHRNI